MKPPLQGAQLWQNKSPPSRGVWIETKSKTKVCLKKASPPSRGVWIET